MRRILDDNPDGDLMSEMGLDIKENVPACPGGPGRLQMVGGRPRAVGAGFRRSSSLTWPGYRAPLFSASALVYVRFGSPWLRASRSDPPPPGCYQLVTPCAASTLVSYDKSAGPAPPSATKTRLNPCASSRRRLTELAR